MSTETIEQLREQIAELQAKLAENEAARQPAQEPATATEPTTEPASVGLYELAESLAAQSRNFNQRRKAAGLRPSTLMVPDHLQRIFNPPAPPPPRRAATGLDDVASRLGIDTNWISNVVQHESGGRLDAINPTTRATGLLQWLPSTARGLGTSVESIATMAAEDQHELIYRYLEPFKGRIANEGDLAMAVFWPRAVGKSDETVLFKRGTKAYEANATLDRAGRGYITRGDVLARSKRGN